MCGCSKALSAFILNLFQNPDVFEDSRAEDLGFAYLYIPGTLFVNPSVLRTEYTYLGRPAKTGRTEGVSSN